MSCGNGCGCDCNSTTTDVTITKEVICALQVIKKPCDKADEIQNNHALEQIRKYLCGLIITTEDVKVGQLICLDQESYPTTLTSEPPSTVTLPTTLIDGYTVTIEYDSGYVKHIYKDGAWSSCGRDFLSGGTLTVSE